MFHWVCQKTNLMIKHEKGDRKIENKTNTTLQQFRDDFEIPQNKNNSNILSKFRHYKI